MFNPARSFTRKALRLAAGLAVVVASTAGVQAACIDAALYDLADYKAGQQKALSRLQFEKQFVLCFTAGSTGFVQILDTPAQGDIEIIYPNQFLHDADGNLQYAAIEGGKQYCFGDADTFPLYHPREEGNTGKLAITVTLSEANQIDGDTWEIPGEAKKYLGSHKQAAEACSGRDILYIDYRAE